MPRPKANKGTEKHIGLRIDEETHYKMTVVAEAENRSLNGQIVYAIKKTIEDYEKKNKVKIPFPTED